MSGYSAPPGHYSPDTIPDEIHNLTSESVTKHQPKKDSHEQARAIARHELSRHYGPSTDDEGHVGQHQNDVVALRNAHPHQSHTVNYVDDGGPRKDSYMTHGFQAVHITHHKRDKGAEHHPPKGLMVHGAVDHERDTQTIYG